MILRTQRSLCLPVAAGVLGLISWTCPVARTAEANPWQQLTREDLAAVRQLVQENHPGPVDSENPAFGAHLEADFAAADRLAEQARSYEDWLFALRFYAASFQDGHLEFGESVHRDTVRWPGFLVVYTGNGKYRVAGLEPGPPKVEERPPAGAELLSCDGQTPAQRMTDVLPSFGIRDLEASLFRYAPRLLVDEGNRAHPAPKTCRVRVGGDEKEYPLHWQAIPQQDLATKRRLAGRGPRVKSSLEVTPDGGAWLRLCDFNPSEEDARALHEVLARLPARTSSLTCAATMVATPRGARRPSGTSSARRRWPNYKPALTSTRIGGLPRATSPTCAACCRPSDATSGRTARTRRLSPTSSQAWKTPWPAACPSTRNQPNTRGRQVGKSPRWRLAPCRPRTTGRSFCSPTPGTRARRWISATCS